MDTNHVEKEFMDHWPAEARSADNASGHAAVARLQTDAHEQFEPTADQVAEEMRRLGTRDADFVRERLTHRLRVDIRRLAAVAPDAVAAIEKAAAEAAEAQLQAESVLESKRAALDELRRKIIVFSNQVIRYRRLLALCGEQKTGAGDLLRLYLESVESPCPATDQRFAAAVQRRAFLGDVAEPVKLAISTCEKEMASGRTEIQEYAKECALDLAGVVKTIQADWRANQGNFQPGFSPDMPLEILQPRPGPSARGILNLP